MNKLTDEQKAAFNNVFELSAKIDTEKQPHKIECSVTIAGIKFEISTESFERILRRIEQLELCDVKRQVSTIGT